jgi:hypothetical protein
MIGRLVALVRVPDDGVPSAPLKVTRDPADPTLTASAVPTPVPRPVIPEIGRPVAEVRTRVEGVPRFGVTRVGEVPKTRAPVPVSSVIELRSAAEVIEEAAVP